jgi:hypothetical protein
LLTAGSMGGSAAKCREAVRGCTVRNAAALSTVQPAALAIPSPTFPNTNFIFLSEAASDMTSRGVANVMWQMYINR